MRRASRHTLNCLMPSFLGTLYCLDLMYFVYCKDMQHSMFGRLSRMLGMPSKYHFWWLKYTAVEDNHNSIGSQGSQWMVWSDIVDVFDRRTDAHIDLRCTGNIENTGL